MPCFAKIRRDPTTSALAQQIAVEYMLPRIIGDVMSMTNYIKTSNFRSIVSLELSRLWTTEAGKNGDAPLLQRA